MKARRIRPDDRSREDHTDGHETDRRPNAATWSRHVQVAILQGALDSDGLKEFLGEVADALLMVPTVKLSVLAQCIAEPASVQVVAVAGDEVHDLGLLGRRVTLPTALEHSLSKGEVFENAITMEAPLDLLVELAPRYPLNWSTAIPVRSPSGLQGVIFLISGQEKLLGSLGEDGLKLPSQLIEIGWELHHSAHQRESSYPGEDNGDDSFSRTLSVLPLGAVLVDPEFRIERTNHRFREMSGYEPFEIRGTCLHDLLSTKPSSDIPVSNVHETSESSLKSQVLLGSNGKRTRVQTSVLPLQGPRFADARLLVLLESTEEILADLESLDRERATISSALGITPVAVILCDLEGKMFLHYGGLADTLGTGLPDTDNFLEALRSLHVEESSISEMVLRERFDLTIRVGDRYVKLWSSRLEPSAGLLGTPTIAVLCMNVTETLQARQALEADGRRNQAMVELTRAAIEGADTKQWSATLERELTLCMPGVRVHYLSAKAPAMLFDVDEVSKYAFGPLAVPDRRDEHEQLVFQSHHFPHTHVYPVRLNSDDLDCIEVEVSRHLTREERAFLEAAAAVASVRIQTLAYEAELERIASFDRQFGVLNRRSFTDRLARHGQDCSAQQQCAVLIRITNAEQLRETLGIETSDRLTREWLGLLGTHVPPTVSIFALHYNQFALLIPNGILTPGLSVAQGLAKLASALTSIVTYEGLSVSLRTKLAGVVLEASSRARYQEVYGTLDRALRTVSGAGSWILCDHLDTSDVQAHERGLQSLTAYFTGRALETIFEPVFDVGANRVVMYETKTPLRKIAGENQVHQSSVAPLLASGLVTTVESVELARMSSFACGQEFSPDVILSVNCSVGSLMSGRLRAALIRHGSSLAPWRLGFEISELYLAKLPIRSVKEAVEDLQSHGGFVLLDEVGRGYSSLALLRDVPFDAIKLSRQLVQPGPPSRRELTKILVTLAQDLEVMAIATGVSTREISNDLLELGAGLQQGTYITGLLGSLARS